MVLFNIFAGKSSPNINWEDLQGLRVVDSSTTYHQVEPPKLMKILSHPSFDVIFVEIREICMVYYHHYHGMCAIFIYTVFIYIYIYP